MRRLVSFFNFSLVVFTFTLLFIFKPFFIDSKLPIPSDTIIGLYHPFRDLYADKYPNGIPFKNFMITDPVRQQLPWKFLGLETEKKGEFPIWNPYNFSGTPLLANFQSGAFYPLNALFFVMPFYLAWSLYIFSQPLLALIFMFLFLRNLKLSIESSILGSISFAFCGFFVSWMEWGNVVSTALWLPLILLSIDKSVLSIKYKVLSIRKISIWNLIYLFALISSFFAGHLQVFFYAYIVSIFYFFARWWNFGKNRKTLLVYIILNALFIILTSAQWLPTLQFILASARNLDQSWHNPGWFMPFQNLTQFIAPDFFGNPATLNYWGVWNYGEFMGYIGFIPLILALYSAIFVRRKIVWFFLFIFISSLVFALPTIIAKIPFKFEFPFLSTSQPTRLMFLADFSLSILAAFGLEYFLQNKKRIFIPLSIIGLLLISFWGFVFFNQQLPTNLHIESINLAVSSNNLKLPTLLFIVSLFIFIFYIILQKRFKYAKHLFIFLILLITIFDLYRFTTKYITFADAKYLFPDTKIISFLKNQTQPFRIISTDSRIFPPNFSIMYKIQTLDGYDPLFLQRYAELSAAISREEPNINPPFGFNRIITIQNYRSNFINLLNVKYILSLGEIKIKNAKKIMSEGETVLYENTNVIPRAFFINKTINAENKYDSIKKLFENKDALKTLAIVEDESFSKTDKWSIKNSKVSIQAYEANAIIIQTENKGKGFLVLTDSYYPTWKAKICNESENNCQETKIYLTDYNFRGIIVPAGNHSIKFYNSLL